MTPIVRGLTVGHLRSRQCGHVSERGDHHAGDDAADEYTNNWSNHRAAPGRARTDGGKTAAGARDADLLAARDPHLCEQLMIRLQLAGPWWEFVRLENKRNEVGHLDVS